MTMLEQAVMFQSLTLRTLETYYQLQFLLHKLIDQSKLGNGTTCTSVLDINEMLSFTTW